jgi:hypothetical protein
MSDLPWLAIVMMIVSLATLVAAWWADNILLGCFSAGVVMGLCGGVIEGIEWQKRFKKTSAAIRQETPDD